jgi:NADH-quinone oxidoreductase subunit M
VLSVIVFLPALAAAGLLAVPARAPRAVFGAAWTAVATADLVLVAVAWAGYHPHGGFAWTEDVTWIPAAGVGYHVGVDGLSLPLIALTAVLFLAVAVYCLRDPFRPKSRACLFLFLQTVCLGVFTALDLILFFVYFDLSIVGMFFVIAGWGHGDRARAAAVKFFLYTFTGSLALLLGFIGLDLAARPHTFDMVTLIRTDPLAGRGGYAGLVLLAVMLGLAVKTPVVPFHTWLPPAHTEAPAAGSAILAGVLLKLGTYGFFRIAMPMLPGSWRQYAAVFIVMGTVSVVYGALVALGQRSFKRMIAYTSVNHMGYILLAAGAAGVLAHGDAQARALAVTGGVTQMVSHGLLTGALFLLSGVLYNRGGSYDMDAYSGLAARMPAFAAVTAVAAFGSLGLPGLAGFIAEFQVFTGSFATAAAATGIALTGILITTALFLRALRKIFTGPLRLPGAAGAAGAFGDLTVSEAASTVPLLALAVLIGVAPGFLLDVIEPAARTVTVLVAR